MIINYVNGSIYAMRVVAPLKGKLGGGNTFYTAPLAHVDLY